VPSSDVWDYSVEAARADTAHSYVYGGRSVSRYDAIAAAERYTAVDSDEIRVAMEAAG
jgi:hypothetical protein